MFNGQSSYPVYTPIVSELNYYKWMASCNIVKPKREKVNQVSHKFLKLLKKPKVSQE